ncbi:MAG TPA: hypothetical protein DDZ62_13330 [Delftia acidovorans]|uniref:hypothetical protein n=1 Tax=Delftia acidovorans TaxID=80866 RepID=UPI0009B83E28|nr:hypothetical protein [Delftia sp. SD083]MBO1037291.1 hypothetical protein [Delftia sp. SD018]QQB53727.1 hypothetical protein I6H54_17370 [Delftia acidovorans]HBK00831.1 hypothetical protein [Delftia acidovorans]
MGQERRSPHYTAEISELPQARALQSVSDPGQSCACLTPKPAVQQPRNSANFRQAKRKP